MKSNHQIVNIPFSKIFLDLKNPRHEPYETQDEAIEYLCKEEYVFELAKDIAQLGTNPLELFALIPNNPAQKNTIYTVSEGNRRMCALMLLNDPDLAPTKYKKDFKKLSAQWDHIKQVYGVLFKNNNEVKIWLDRIHGGLQDGIGRKNWNPEQKTRFTGDSKHKLSQAVLDYAEHNRLITAEERKNKLTTVSRYISNADFRHAIGLASNSETLKIDRTVKDFNTVLKKFLKDLANNKINSRSNKEDIKSYAQNLNNTRGLSQSRGKPKPITFENDNGKTGKGKLTPQRPKKQLSVSHSEEIGEGLRSINNYKLQKLYYSICTIKLEEHTPLVSVGAWSFIETLSACMGRNESTPFTSFFSKEKLRSLGFGDSKAVRDALDRISSYGNNTKHHQTSANFNGEQLANDMATLKELIISCINSLNTKKAA